MKILFKLAIDPDIENIAKMRSSVNKSLQSVRIQNTAINQILLTASEITTNFIEHSPSILKLYIHLSYTKDHIKLHIYEYSSNSNNKRLISWLEKVKRLKKEKKSPIETFDLNRSGGRGTSIIAELVDNIEYCTSEVTKNNKLVQIQGFSLSWDIEPIRIKKRILIVDDDIAISKLYENYLSSTFDVISVNSVKEALVLLNQAAFDLILSDIHLPDEDGVSLRSYVSQHKSAKKTPFIFMSGDEAADHLQNLSNLGIDDFITKPVSKKRLINRISRVLTRVSQLTQINDLLRTQSITESLIPKIPPDLSPWRLNAISDGPGDGGGDLLIVKKQNKETIIIMADLMGHDVAAKFFSHAYLGYIRGLLCASNPEPEEFLSLLSNAIYEDELLSKSMCTCCAIKLCHNGLIRVATAGHPLPIILSNQREIPIEVEGMLPGLMPNIVYASKEYYLKKGERLIAYTDGFIDPSYSQTGNNCTDELLGTLKQSLDTPLKKALKHTFDVLKRTKKSRLEDDCLLVLAEPIYDHGLLK